MRFLLRLIASAAALAIATWILSDITLTASSTLREALVLLVVALIFGVLNAIIKPILTFLSIPLLLITLGLFLLVINACMLLLTSWLAELLGIGWHVEGFWTAVIGAIIVSIVSFVLNAFLPDPDKYSWPRRHTKTGAAQRYGCCSSAGATSAGLRWPREWPSVQPPRSVSPTWHSAAGRPAPKNLVSRSIPGQHPSWPKGATGMTGIGRIKSPSRRLPPPTW